MVMYGNVGNGTTFPNHAGVTADELGYTGGVGLGRGFSNPSAVWIVVQ